MFDYLHLKVAWVKLWHLGCQVCAHLFLNLKKKRCQMYDLILVQLNNELSVSQTHPEHSGLCKHEDRIHFQSTLLDFPTLGIKWGQCDCCDRFHNQRNCISLAPALVRLCCFDVRLHDETRLSVDVKDVGGPQREQLDRIILVYTDITSELGTGECKR